VIEFIDVVKTFKTPSGLFDAVNHVTFTVSPGECCCLCGPNGAGKTTSILMMLGFLPVTRGQIKVCGTSVVSEAVKARRVISYIPDQPALYRNLTALQNLSFFDELLGRRRTDDEYLELLARVDLVPKQAHRKVWSFSKGMMQRLAIAISLLKNAQVYVFDEPTTGLDPRGIFDFLEICSSLTAQGRTVLITTHDLLHVQTFATTVQFMVGGRIARTFDRASLAHVKLEQIYLELTAEQSQQPRRGLAQP